MNATTCRKALTAQISGSTAKGFTAVITAETLDRDGEVLIPSGMNSKEFEQNPVLFWNHDYALPVGKCVKLVRRARDIVVGGGVIVVVVAVGVGGVIVRDVFSVAIETRDVDHRISVGVTNLDVNNVVIVQDRNVVRKVVGGDIGYRNDAVVIVVVGPLWVDLVCMSIDDGRGFVEEPPPVNRCEARVRRGSILRSALRGDVVLDRRNR